MIQAYDSGGGRVKRSKKLLIAFSDAEWNLVKEYSEREHIALAALMRQMVLKEIDAKHKAKEMGHE